MIQVSALTAPPATVSTTETVQGQPGDGAETADFSAILASETVPSTPRMGSPVAIATVPEPMLAQLPDLAALPEGGKILPEGLPQPLPGKAQMALPRRGASLSGQHAASQPEARPAKPEDSEADTPATLSPEHLLNIINALPLLPAQAAAATPTEAPSTASAAPKGIATPAMPLPATLAAQPKAQAQAQPQGQPQLPVLELDRAAPPALAASLAALEPSAAPALPGGVTARLKLNPAATATNEAAASPGTYTATLLGAPLANASHPAAPGSAPFAAAPLVQPASRPHDFTALIDSLVAAREAAQPHTVSVALATAEFGAVHVRFNQDDNGLSVTMASANPDFARAASAAMPPPAPATSADASGQQNAGSQPRQQGQAAASGGGSSQGGGASTSQHQDRAATRENPSPRASTTARRSATSGIFA